MNERDEFQLHAGVIDGVVTEERVREIVREEVAAAMKAAALEPTESS